MNRDYSLASSTHSGLMRLVADLSTAVAVPQGVTLRDDAELLIWQQFTSARTQEAWRDFDLLLVAKAVRLESDIRKYQAQLDAQEMFVEANGKLVVNPLVALIKSMLGDQLTLIRALSLCQTGQNPTTMNDRAIKQAKLREDRADMSDLIAQ